ncbi:MAG: sulfotransferase [Candidatus Sedimenticola sp. (ex Thyasira tokunagai)]
MNTDKETHILILGSPRSGTTLLSAMLGCHPAIAILNEDYCCSEFKIFSKRVRGNKLCVPNQIELTHDIYTRISDSIVSLYQRISNTIRSKLHLRTPIVRGAKARLSIREYEHLADNLHIIGIIRSPDNVIRSIKKRGQQLHTTSEYRWCRSIEVLYDLLNSRQPTVELTIIHYDRLISSPEEVMRICLNKMECEYDDSVLDGFKYTPQYKGMTKIDTNKVSGGLDQDLEYPLLVKNKELAKKYSTLVERSL